MSKSINKIDTPITAPLLSRHSAIYDYSKRYDAIPSSSYDKVERKLKQHKSIDSYNCKLIVCSTRSQMNKVVNTYDNSTGGVGVWDVFGVRSKFGHRTFKSYSSRYYVWLLKSGEVHVTRDDKKSKYGFGNEAHIRLTYNEWFDYYRKLSAITSCIDAENDTNAVKDNHDRQLLRLKSSDATPIVMRETSNITGIPVDIKRTGPISVVLEDKDNGEKDKTDNNVNDNNSDKTTSIKRAEDKDAIRKQHERKQRYGIDNWL